MVCFLASSFVTIPSAIRRNQSLLSVSGDISRVDRAVIDRSR
jgi:hypothetical protein